MTDSGPIQRAREEVTGIVAVLVTGTWLAALATGQDWWLAFMLFGYVVLVPIVALLFGDRADVATWWEEDNAVEKDRRLGSGEADDDALATLRDRYARGEITDEQFERKLDRLLETETIEDLEDRPAGIKREDVDTETGREFSG